MNRPDVAELARVTDPEERRSVGAIRRMAVKVTTKVLWQLLGHKIDALVETLQAEPFTGIGFYARPPRDGRPEAIVVNVGGTASPAVVAMRDERTRARMAGDLAEGETAMYGSGTIVVAGANAVEVRSQNGVAVALATKADIDAVIALYNAHTHTVPIVGPAGTTPTTVPLPAFAASPAVGTAVLRGE